MIAEEHQVGVRTLNIQANLHRNRTIVPLLLGGVLERPMEEHTALVAQIDTVELNNLVPRYEKQPLGKSLYSSSSADRRIR